jgi:hypothetical protein
MDPVIKRWLDEGKGIPAPPQYKIEEIKRYAKDFDIKVFVETGTFRCTTLRNVEQFFQKVYSIELKQKFYEDACREFSNKSHITLIKGDSCEELPKLIPAINQKALFWLDAHWSMGDTARGNKDSALENELPAILTMPEEMGNVILIDDTYSLKDSEGYLSVEKIKDMITNKYPNYKIEIDGYIIRAFPEALI